MAAMAWDCFIFLLVSVFVLLLSVSIRLWIGARRRPGREQEEELFYKPSALAKHLLRHCGSLSRPGPPAAWPLGGPHLQTLWGLLPCGEPGGALHFTRDHLLLRDGGVVAVDWAVETGRGARDGRRSREGKASGCFGAVPPLLLIIPHWWGGVSPHLRALCLQAMRQGYYVVVFQPRGTAECPLTSARLTEFGDPADLEQAITYIHSRHPSSVLLAVSEGSGSGILLSYLGECGSSTSLTAAAAISPVLQGQQWFAMSTIYHRGVLFRRKQQLRRYASSFRGILDVDRALSSSSLRDFEETLFCSSGSTRLAPSVAPSVASWALGGQRHRAQDWDGYWERNEPLRGADEVAVPVLCIRSRDDPLLPPASALPLALFQSNPHFFLALTDRGGHCGFAQDARGHAENDEEEEEEEVNWSHVVVLEFFRVVAGFLKGEERDGGEKVQAGMPRSRSSNVATLPRKRGGVTRRPRAPAMEQSRVDAEEEKFTWKRSYTR